ncbi:MAG: glucose-1-phosphate thymidylyltransferase, partial [Anaerolineae bacterium]|nr:glucose-1-phosphate thymidylyltransferase [Anaerolineae bacterium]
IVVGDTHAEIEKELGNGSRWSVNIQYIPQASPDGLAHAVKISHDFLGDDRFVMFLGDNVIQGGISSLIRDFAQSDWNSQIVLKEIENPTSYGVAKLRSDGSIEQLVEKPKVPPSNLALVGIYMFDPHIFEAVNAIKPSARGEYEITDAIQWMIDKGYRVYPYVHRGWWVDTGKGPDMLEANSLVLEELTPAIAPDAVIENSQVDRRVTVESGARIINSVVRGPAIIGKDTLIEHSYIGPFTSIYHHVTVKNAEIERSIILENSAVSDIGVRIQDSLIGRNASVRRGDEKPRAIKMNLGDHSTVWIL